MICVVDVEAEDMELGVSTPDDLAPDVDDSLNEEDEGALDSEEQIEEELGLNPDEETEGMLLLSGVMLTRLKLAAGSANAYYSIILAAFQ